MLNLNVRVRSIGRIRLAAVAACLAVFGVRSQYCSFRQFSRPDRDGDVAASASSPAAPLKPPRSRFSRSWLPLGQTMRRASFVA